MKIRFEVMIFFVVIIIQIIYVVGLYNSNQICLHDSISHLNHGRRIIDENYPGWGQIGHIWLPLVFLCYVPFVWNDFLWHSCLAGSIVSIIFLAIASVFVYKLATELYETKYAGIVAFLIFFMNPSVRLIGAVPMFEGPLLMPLAGSAYYFLLWIKTERHRYLFFASMFASVATLIRYEAWFIPLLFFILVPLILIFRKRKYAFIEGNVFLVVPWAFLGVILWMAYLTVIFRDPFCFTGGDIIERGIIRTMEHTSQTSTDLIGISVGIFSAYSNIFGDFTLISAIIGIILVCCLYRNWSISIFIILLVPLLFSIWRVHPVYTDEPRHILQNIIFVSIGASAWIKLLSVSKFKYFLLTISIIIIVLNILFIPENAVKNQLEPSGYHATENNIGRYLNEHYTGGMILCNPLWTGEYVIFYSNLSPREFIEPHDQDLWLDALKSPWEKAEYVVMSTGPEEEPISERWLKNEEFEMHYIQVYSFGDYIIFKRK